MGGSRTGAGVLGNCGKFLKTSKTYIGMYAKLSHSMLGLKITHENIYHVENREIGLTFALFYALKEIT